MWNIFSNLFECVTLTIYKSKHRRKVKMQVSLSQKILSEFIGTYLLLLTVVGSGIMGETLSDNKAVT